MRLRDKIKIQRLESKEGANVILDHIHPTGGVASQFFYRVNSIGEELRAVAEELRYAAKAERFTIIAED